MSIIIKEMSVKHECDREPAVAVRGRMHPNTGILWPDYDVPQAAWRFCPYCAAPLPQDLVAVIKAVS